MDFTFIDSVKDKDNCRAFDIIIIEGVTCYDIKCSNRKKGAIHVRVPVIDAIKQTYQKLDDEEREQIIKEIQNI